MSSRVKQNKSGITGRHMIITKRKLSPSPGGLRRNSRRIKTWSYITRMERESSGRGCCRRGHGRSHGERGCGKSFSRNNQDEQSNKTNPFKLKTKLKDAIFDIDPVTTRAHECHNNLKFLLSHTQQKFKGGNDIVK